MGREPGEEGASVRIAPEGWPVILIVVALCVLAGAVAAWLHPVAGGAMGLVGVLMIAWSLWFFRDPIRTAPKGVDLVISPADGKVIKIDRAALPEEVRQGDSVARPRVSIFLNLFDVHVNRVPVAGVIKQLSYVPGKFFNASLDKASIYNERSAAVMVDDQGREVAFVQIAGLVARRIVNHLKPGQRVEAGERFGLIRFGSRAEVYLPEGSLIDVKVGQRVVAGTSVLGRLPVVSKATLAVGVEGAGVSS